MAARRQKKAEEDAKTAKFYADLKKKHMAEIEAEKSKDANDVKKMRAENQKLTDARNAAKAAAEAEE